MVVGGRSTWKAGKADKGKSFDGQQVHHRRVAIHSTKTFRHEYEVLP